MRAVSLHSHSTFSFMDGFGPPADHVARVAELGMPALALTEHGNVSSHVQLERAAKKHGITPIYGLEAYTAPEKTRDKWHLTVLASDDVGYRNLNRIVTRSYSHGFYQWPTVGWNSLEKWNAGLVLLSGCSDSLLSCTLLGGKSTGPKRDKASSWDVDNAERLVRRFQETYGDRYFLEAQRFPQLARTRTLNPILVELSRRTGAQVVATADVHYPMPDGNKMQVALHAAGRGAVSVDAQAASWEYDILLTYPLSDAEFVADVRATGLSKRDAEAAVYRTEEVAQRCAGVKLPRFERLTYPDAERQLWEWLRAGWHFRMAQNRGMQSDPPKYVARVKHEMSVILEKGFEDYFAMLAFVVGEAKKRGIIVGPGRGSAAASLVLYLLRVTEVDPLEFPNMMFERFLDPTRVDLPDVDLDFEAERRAEVRQIMVDKFGDDCVANVANFVRYRGRNAVNDIARVHGIPALHTEIVKSVIPERSQGDARISESLADTFQMFPSAAAVLQQYPDLQLAVELEGNYRGMNVHAAGIVVAAKPIRRVCATYSREVGKHKQRVEVIPYDLHDAEYLGALKADILSLSTLSVWAHVLRSVGMTLDELYAVPLDDPETLLGFRETDVVGIFQFEGRATRLLCREVEPDRFMHLADIAALSRPGPLVSGTASTYVEVRHGRKNLEDLHPVVAQHTAATYGQLVYQEQILAVMRDMGGFSIEEVARMRKIISKKLGEAQFNELLDRFADGALHLHDTDHDGAARVWDSMVKSAAYAFNVAHSVSYAMIAYYSMYLKRNFPAEFFAGQLEHSAKEDALRLLKDARRRGIPALAPDLHRSRRSWSTHEEGLLAGFQQIPGIAETRAREIVAYRDVHRPNRWEGLAAVRGIGEKTVEKMRNFAEGEDPFGLDEVKKMLSYTRKAIKYGNLKGRVPYPTIDSNAIARFDAGREDRSRRVVWAGMVHDVRFADYIENERARTGDSIEEIRKEMRDPDLVKSARLRAYDDRDEEVYLRVSRWIFPRLKRTIEGIVPDRSVVVVVGSIRQGAGVAIAVRRMYVLKIGDEDEDEHPA